ncbi:MAG: DUF3106 domain-containing protein [Candidatus Acidiferrales bacterium]
MRFRRLISVVALALIATLAAEPCLAAGRPGSAWQGTFRTVRQERVQPMPRARQARRQQRVHARRQALKANKAGNHPASANGGFQRFQPNAKVGQFNRAENGAVARPPNQRLFEPNPKVLRRLPPRMLQRFETMSPEQQERFLENNRRFQSLPPAKQAQIRQNLQRWNGLSPAERDQMIHRNEVWQRLSPEQRQFYRNQILPKWQQMSPDRRQLVIGRLHTLQGMTPDQQQKALNDPRFMQGLSLDEQGVLRNLSSLRN